MTEESKTPVKPAKPVRGRGRLMTTKEKAEVVALWEAGEVTLADLATRFGRDSATISKVLSDAKAVKGRVAASVIEKARAKVEEDSVSDAAILAQRIKETKDEHYKASRRIAMMVTLEVMNASKPGADLANRQGTLKALETAAKALKTVREERFAVLGILNGEEVNVEDLPDLVVQELSADDVAMLRSMGGEGDIDDVGDEEILPVEGALTAIEEEEEDDAVIEEGA